MNLITPFEFVQKHPEGKSLAIIGNARSLASYEMGEVIDSHDTVVRFNEFATEGFEKSAGTRTDILVCNPYAETRPNCLPPEGRETVLVINPLTRRGNQDDFEKWVGDRDVLFSYCPSLVGVENSAHVAGMTSGTNALQLLPRILLPSKLTVTGFSMFAEAENSYYWKSGKPGGMKSHDFSEEAQIFCRIFNSFTFPVDVTPDVAAVFERQEIKPKKWISFISA